MNTAFRISAVPIRIKRHAGQILSAAFICLRPKPGRKHPDSMDTWAVTGKEAKGFCK
jgi:hypothetical protein